MCVNVRNCKRMYENVRECTVNVSNCKRMYGNVRKPGERRNVRKCVGMCVKELIFVSGMCGNGMVWLLRGHTLPAAMAPPARKTFGDFFKTILEKRANTMGGWRDERLE